MRPAVLEIWMALRYLVSRKVYTLNSQVSAQSHRQLLSCPGADVALSTVTVSSRRHFTSSYRQPCNASSGASRADITFSREGTRTAGCLIQF